MGRREELRVLVAGAGGEEEGAGVGTRFWPFPVPCGAGCGVHPGVGAQNPELSPHKLGEVKGRRWGGVRGERGGRSRRDSGLLQPTLCQERRERRGWRGAPLRQRGGGRRPGAGAAWRESGCVRSRGERRDGLCDGGRPGRPRRL